MVSLDEFKRSSRLVMKIKTLPLAGVFATISTQMVVAGRGVHVMLEGNELAGRPNLDEILARVAVACRGIDKATWFGDWCEITGNDVNAKVSRRLYKRAMKLRKHLRAILGPEHYNLLVYGCDLSH